ncbi:putative GTPase effector domain, dynamin [Septoria linicola]|nr:putative GTPase effector domain, dynamin [Septoria linicola]
MERRLDEADLELVKLIKDKNLSSIVHDPAYPANVQKLLNHKLNNELSAAAASRYAMHNVPVSKLSQVGMNENARMTAEHALDHQLALYERLITNIAEQIIDHHLTRDLAQDTFSPDVVEALTDEEVSKMAAEAPGVAKRREELERKKAILEKSRKVFQRLINPNKRTAEDMEGPNAASSRKRLARKSLLE